MKYTLLLVGITVLSFGCATKDTIEFNSSNTCGDCFSLLNGNPISEDRFNELVENATLGEVDIIFPIGNVRMDLIEFKGYMDEFFDSPMSFSEFDVMCYHIQGDELILEFHEESLQSSFSQSAIKTTFMTNNAARTLEITIMETFAGAQVSQTIENGNEIISIEFSNFDRQKDRVLYRDDNGTHEIPFESIRDESFKLYEPEPIDIDDIFK